MTPEEMQRKMEFIVEHQAKFELDIEKLFEADERQRESQATLTAAVVRIAEIIEENRKDMDERFRETDQRIKDLVTAQKGTDERLRQTDERLRQTDDRLNALLHVVERHVTGPDHGHAPH